MCPPIIGVILTVVGSLATAAMGAGIAKQQALIEQRQLRTEIENERIKAIGATSDRLEDLRKAEATNRAVLSTSGVDNISYIQGAAPYNQRVMARDVRRTEFNAGQEVGRKKYEIEVAGWRAKSTAMSGYVSAAADSLGAIGTHFASGRPTANSVTP
jgi:hypothetical protein